MLGKTFVVMPIPCIRVKEKKRNERNNLEKILEKKSLKRLKGGPLN